MRRAYFILRLLIAYPALLAVGAYAFGVFGNAFLGVTLAPLGATIALIIAWYGAIAWNAKSFIDKIRML